MAYPPPPWGAAYPMLVMEMSESGSRSWYVLFHDCRFQQRNGW